MPDTNGNVNRDLRNREALDMVAKRAPCLVDIRPAGDVVPDLAEDVMLHAGPPLGDGESMPALMRAAVEGTLVVNGTTKTLSEAHDRVEAGRVRLDAAQNHNALGTYGAVIGSKTPVFVVEDKVSGERTFAAINEGRGKALRYGANDASTLNQLRWLETEFADVLGGVIRRSGGIDLFAITEQAIRMGDEGHSRQKAGSLLFANVIAVRLVAEGASGPPVRKALDFLVCNEFFYLSLSMASAKCALKAAERVQNSTIVTCMAFNGSQFGMQVSGRPGRWYTAPVPEITGKYFEGYSGEDACPVVGDSEIAETIGLGAFAMAAAPALAPYIGGTPTDAADMAKQMYDITCAEHPRFRIPAWEFRGTPFGVDVARVLSTGITPIFSTGIAHQRPGLGQIGAGVGRAPFAAFEAAGRDMGLSAR